MASGGYGDNLVVRIGDLYEPVGFIKNVFPKISAKTEGSFTWSAPPSSRIGTAEEIEPTVWNVRREVAWDRFRDGEKVGADELELVRSIILRRLEAAFAVNFYGWSPAAPPLPVPYKPEPPYRSVMLTGVSPGVLIADGV